MFSARPLMMWEFERGKFEKMRNMFRKTLENLSQEGRVASKNGWKITQKKWDKMWMRFGRSADKINMLKDTW